MYFQYTFRFIRKALDEHPQQLRLQKKSPLKKGGSINNVMKPGSLFLLFKMALAIQ
jgi:hypothetical protein